MHADHSVASTISLIASWAEWITAAVGSGQQWMAAPA